MPCIKLERERLFSSTTRLAAYGKGFAKRSSFVRYPFEVALLRA